MKYLGVHIDSNLGWNVHVHVISWRIYLRLKLLNRVYKYLSWKLLSTIHKQTILQIMDYGCIVRGDGGKQNALHLDRHPNHAMRIFFTIFKQQKTVHQITLWCTKSPTTLTAHHANWEDIKSNSLNYIFVISEAAL